jgi:hypothetical protein
LPGLLESDAAARVQLTRTFLSLSQKFRIIRKRLGFLLGMNPLEKDHPGFLRKLRNGFLNFLDCAHSD